MGFWSGVGGFFKTIGKTVWKGVKSDAFRELATAVLMEKLAEHEAKRGK